MAPEPPLTIRVSEYTGCALQKPHATAQQGAPSVPNNTINSKDSRRGRPPLIPGGARPRISGPSNLGAELNCNSSLGCHSTGIPASRNTKSRVVKKPGSRSELSELVQMRTPISIIQSHGRQKAVTSLEQQLCLNTLTSSTNSIQNQPQVGINQAFHERPTVNDAVIPVWQKPIVPGSFSGRNIPRGVRRPKVPNTNSIPPDTYLIHNSK